MTCPFGIGALPFMVMMVVSRVINNSITRENKPELGSHCMNFTLFNNRKGSYFCLIMRYIS